MSLNTNNSKKDSTRELKKRVQGGMEQVEMSDGSFVTEG